MRIDKHEIKLNHSLANIKIQPLDDIDSTDLKNLIKLALDSYALRLNQSIPASVIHSEIRNKHQEDFGTPGYYLRLFRSREDLSQGKLAENIGIKQHHISEMEKNKRPIGKTLAKKFATVFGCDYKKFL